jgi:hypothetical protein
MTEEKGILGRMYDAVRMGLDVILMKREAPREVRYVGAHLDDFQIFRLARNTLFEEELPDVIDHLDNCGECKTELVRTCIDIGIRYVSSSDEGIRAIGEANVRRLVSIIETPEGLSGFEKLFRQRVGYLPEDRRRRAEEFFDEACREYQGEQKIEEENTRTRQWYYKNMSVDELAEFMVTEQSWDLARLEQATIRAGGEFSSKPVAVEGADGIRYSGVARAYHHWEAPNNPRLVLTFVLEKGQRYSEPLKDRMTELGYHLGLSDPVRSE